MQQRLRRVLAAGAAFLAAGVMLVVNAAWQDQRQQAQYEVARDAGCFFVSREHGLEWQLRMWYATGEYPLDGYSLLLRGKGVDEDWLHEHEWLAGLNARALYGADQCIPAADLSRFIDEQPLVFIELGDYPLDDNLLLAIRTRNSLTMLSLRDSNFDDEDLASLPLERYESLILSRSSVTPAGLSALHRCRRLKEIELDGRQLTAKVAAILDDAGTVHRVLLSGPDVTDNHLQLIGRIRALDDVSLFQTSVTAAGRSKLLAAKPACRIYPPKVAPVAQTKTETATDARQAEKPLIDSDRR